MKKKKLSKIFLLILGMAGLLSCSSKENMPELRKFPYPYQAMLALCSDIDGSTAFEFEQYHKFLNTKESTEMGIGLGLDVADTFWFYMANDDEGSVDYQDNKQEKVMSYFHLTTDTSHNSGLIKYYFENGWIDSMHSFGDFSRKGDPVFKREYAQKAYQEMANGNFFPSIWINHGNEANVQNISLGKKNDYKKGDDPKSPYYHTDITLDGNIKYIWFSDKSNRFGVDNPLYPVTLKDNKKIWGFRRYTGETKWFRHMFNWSKYGLSEQLSPKHLDDLIQNRQYSIVAQHFGGSVEYLPFDDDGIKALRMLADYYNNGDILVARTSRLLNYARAYQYLHYTKTIENNKTIIDILSIKDPQLGESIPTLEEIRGITFYCDEPLEAEIYLNGEIIPQDELQYNNEESKKSIGIKWFTPDTTDYTWGAQVFYH